MQCRIELERTRLLVLEAADQLDRLGNKKARGTIAMAKVITIFVHLRCRILVACAITSKHGVSLIYRCVLSFEIKKERIVLIIGTKEVPTRIHHIYIPTKTSMKSPKTSIDPEIKKSDAWNYLFFWFGIKSNRLTHPYTSMYLFVRGYYNRLALRGRWQLQTWHWRCWTWQCKCMVELAYHLTLF